MSDAAMIRGRKRRGMSDFKLPRRVWSVREEEGLIAALKDIVKQGWKCDNGFRTWYLGVLEQEMVKLFPSSDIKADPHIQSKIHVWKKTYGSIVSMLTRSGFGWNDATNMVIVDDDVWENYVKVDPFVKNMRLKSFPFYPAWCEVFGKDRATGEFAEDIGDVTQPSPDADKCKTPEYYVPTMDSPSNNVFFADNDFISSFIPTDTTMQKDESCTKNKSTKKQKKSLTDLDARYIESIDRFVDRADLRLEMMSKRMGFEFDASEARKKVYEAICKVGSLKVREKLFVAKKLVSDTKSLDLFFSLPDDEKAEFIHMMLDGSV